MERTFLFLPSRHFFFAKPWFVGFHFQNTFHLFLFLFALFNPHKEFSMAFSQMCDGKHVCIQFRGIRAIVCSLKTAGGLEGLCVMERTFVIMSESPPGSICKP